MNKKILTLLIITSMAITGLFATYTAPSVILTSVKPESDYEFKVQKLNSSMNGFEDFDIDQTEIVTLGSTVGTTNAFTISTIENGNMHNPITFSAVVATGEFLDQSADALESGWYPVILDMSASATTENHKRGDETVNYTPGNAGDFTASSIGTYATTFTRGRHIFGTEIARFKLQYKADDKLIAGSYKSTTTITVSVV